MSLLSKVLGDTDMAATGFMFVGTTEHKKLKCMSCAVQDLAKCMRCRQRGRKSDILETSFTDEQQFNGQACTACYSACNAGTCNGDYLYKFDPQRQPRRVKKPAKCCEQAQKQKL